jgi:hypothetical protein
MTRIRLPKINEKITRKIWPIIAILAIVTIVLSSVVMTSEARTYRYPLPPPNPTASPTPSPTPTSTPALNAPKSIFQNGDFESGTSPWKLEVYDPSFQGYAGTFAQSPDSYSGVYSGILTVTGLPLRGSGYVIALQSVPAQVGQTYTMQFYYKGTMTVSPDIYCFSSSWSRLALFTGPVLSANGAWTLVTMRFGPIPSGTSISELHFDVGSTGTFKVDNVVATPTASPSPSPSPVPIVTPSPTPIVTPKPTASPSPSPSPPSTQAAYTITGTGATASAIENGGSHRTTSGATVTVINTVIGWMSANQKTEFLGSFTMSSGISISKSTITLDFGTATLSFGSVSIGITVSGSHVSILNGHLTGGTYAIAGNGATYMLIEGCDIYGQSGASGAGALIFNNACTHNQINNCVLHDSNQPVYFSSNSVNNIISNTEFYGFTAQGSGHGIYFDGGSSGAGYIEVYGCKFHDPATGGNAMVIKSSYNKIHDNQFYNFAGTSMPFSIYTYTGSTGVGNEIYDNTFTGITSSNGVLMTGNKDVSGVISGTKIYSNSFTNCNTCFYLNHETSGDTTGTWIYYNTFNSCTTIFKISATNVLNTVVAQNTFSSSVSNLSFETSYTNTMVYGNTGLADLNVPSPLPIPLL